MHVPAGHRFPDATGVGVCIGLGPPSLLAAILFFFFFFFFSKLNRILEGLNMLEKSGNFAHASELVKIYVWYGFQK